MRLELGLELGSGLGSRLWLRFGLGLGEKFFNVNDPGIELGDGVGDFKKELPDQLCPSA